MMTNDLVSIIIPCYNQAQYLEEAVNSALEQTYSNIEIIIINDGSTDNTENIALGLQKKHPENIQVISQKNSGVSEARNNAIKQSQGQYILPLDADDLIDKNMISSCLKSMIENDVDIVYVDTQCFGIKNYLIRKLPFSENNFLYQNLCNVTSLYKKEMWTKLGGYAKNMKEGYEDWEFWINALKKGYKFQLLSEPLLLYRMQEVSRNTKAVVKDTYLKAKITLNHPELYTIHEVQKSINLIKETESLANLYFYGSKDLTDENYLTKTISHYLSSNSLEEKQLINICDTDIKINLFTLDILKDRKHLRQVLKESEADFILFYSSLRYEVPGLQNLNFSWDKNKGIIDTDGTIFPFVSKLKRECSRSQLVAYKHLVRYQNNKSEIQLARTTQQQAMIEDKIKTIERQEARIQEKNKLIELHRKTIDNKDKAIEDKIKTIERQEARIQEKNKLIELHLKTIEQFSEKININNIKLKEMMNSIEEITRFSIKTNPIYKYKAYKYMIQTYYKWRSSLD